MAEHPPKGAAVEFHTNDFAWQGALPSWERRAARLRTLGPLPGLPSTRLDPALNADAWEAGPLSSKLLEGAVKAAIAAGFPGVLTRTRRAAEAMRELEEEKHRPAAAGAAGAPVSAVSGASGAAQSSPTSEARRPGKHGHPSKCATRKAKRPRTATAADAAAAATADAAASPVEVLPPHTSWQAFYALNKANFFKPRAYGHLIFKALEEVLLRPAEDSGEEEGPVVLEVGCGNGSNVIPLATLARRAEASWGGGAAGPGARGDSSAAEGATSSAAAAQGGQASGRVPSEPAKAETLASSAGAAAGASHGAADSATDAAGPGAAGHPRGKPTIIACDVAETALTAIAALPQFDAGLSRLYQWDVTQPVASAMPLGGAQPPPALQGRCADVAIVTFVLSAVPPGQMLAAMRHIAACVKPGGRVCFIDYAIGDMKVAGLEGTGERAHGAFADHLWLGGRCFRRADGTLSYFFEAQELAELGRKSGLVPERLHPAGWSAGDVEAAQASPELPIQYHTVGLRNRKTGESMARVTVAAQFRKPFAPGSA